MNVGQHFCRGSLWFHKTWKNSYLEVSRIQVFNDKLHKCSFQTNVHDHVFSWSREIRGEFDEVFIVPSLFKSSMGSEKRLLCNTTLIKHCVPPCVSTAVDQVLCSNCSCEVAHRLPMGRGLPQATPLLSLHPALKDVGCACVCVFVCDCAKISSCCCFLSLGSCTMARGLPITLLLSTLLYSGLLQGKAIHISHNTYMD